jgi:hypothetical protein
LRACFLVRAALRLAIAVVLSVPAYLDCFRVSVVKSSAYRRRKQLTDKLHPTTRSSLLAVIAAGGRSPQQKPVIRFRRTRKEWRMLITG